MNNHQFNKRQYAESCVKSSKRRVYEVFYTKVMMLPNKLEMFLFACLLISALFLLLYRLEDYPSPWFDEGINFQVAKNVAQTGQYGLHCEEGLVVFHPAIQTGPTVSLPMAMLFRLGGIGIFQARLIVVFYAIAALVAFYWLVRKISDQKTALLTLLLLIFTFEHEFTSFIFMGRQVLGEIPALAFFWTGTLLWFQTWHNSHRWRLIWSGLLWGLAIITKVQFALMIPGAVLLFWLFDRVSHKRLKIRQFLLPLLTSGLCVLGWYSYQVISLGFGDFWHQTASLGLAGSMHFLNFSPRQTMSAIFQLLGSTLLLLGMPGMFYTLAASLQCRETKRFQQVFIVIFTLVWLAWYAFLSIGWMRYAFVPTAVSTFFSALLLRRLWSWAGQNRQTLCRWLPLTPEQIAVGTVIVALVLSGMIPMMKQIIQSPDSSLQELAQYLNRHIPTDEVIESWELEVDLLTKHNYHHPPYEVTNAFTAHIWHGSPLPPDIYDPLGFRPSYLLDGVFSKWTGLYSPDYLGQECTLVVSIGSYDLYRVNSAKFP